MILECASSLGVCCFCHAAHVSISPLLLHGSQDLSHAGANGLERKSGTLHFLRCVVRHEMFREVQCQIDGVKRQFLLDRVGESPTRTAEHEFQRRAALGGGQRLASKAGASPCPRRYVFPFPGAASNFAASGEYNKKRGRHHDQGSLGGTSPRTLQNKRGQHHDSHSVMSPRRMAKSGGARRGLLVLVLRSSPVEQADSCVHVTTMFFFCSRQFQKSFAKAVLKRYDTSGRYELNRIP